MQTSSSMDIMTGVTHGTDPFGYGGLSGGHPQRLPSVTGVKSQTQHWCIGHKQQTPIHPYSSYTHRHCNILTYYLQTYNLTH